MKSNNPQTRAILPSCMNGAPGVQGLVLGGQELKVEDACVIIKKDDEVPFVMRGFNRKRATDVQMDQLKEARSRWRFRCGMRLTWVLANDAGFTLGHCFI
jgi:hypothetical protein